MSRRRRRELTPLQVPCEACGAAPLMQCWGISGSPEWGMYRAPHTQRVSLASARNRMRRREDGLIARARRWWHSRG